MKFCVNILILLSIAVIFLSIFKKIEKEGYRGHHGHHGHRGHHGHHGHRRHRYHRPSSYIWFNPWYWFRGLCRNGCTNIGRGEWGCQYPGTGPNDCWFASDCIGCGN